MIAAEEGQRRIVQRLHPQRQPVHAGRRRRRRSGRPPRRWDWPPASPRGRSPARTAAARPPTIAPAQSGSISEGVPPPKKIETSRRRPSRAACASRSATMARASAAGPARVAPVAHHVEVAVGADAGAVGPVDVEPDSEPDVAAPLADGSVKQRRLQLGEGAGAVAERLLLRRVHLAEGARVALAARRSGRSRSPCRRAAGRSACRRPGPRPPPPARPARPPPARW